MASVLAIFYLAAQASTPPRSRSLVPMTDASTCNLTAKLFLAPPSRAWRKFSPPWSCAAASRELPSEVLPRISRIHVSLHSSQNSAVFPRTPFLPSRKLLAISARPCAARPSTPVCTPPRDNRAANASRFSSPLSVPASSSAEAGSLPTMDLSVLHLDRDRIRELKLSTEHGTRTTASSRSRSRPRCKAGIHCRHNASLQWRPSRIRHGISAKCNDRIADARRVYRAIQRFCIDDVTVLNRKSIDLVVAVKLHRPRPRATPSAHRRTRDCAARHIHGDDLRAKNSRHSRG